jgi:hypothetical protein
LKLLRNKSFVALFLMLSCRSISRWSVGKIECTLLTLLWWILVASSFFYTEDQHFKVLYLLHKNTLCRISLDFLFFSIITNSEINVFCIITKFAVKNKWKTRKRKIQLITYESNSNLVSAFKMSIKNLHSLSL